jgi:hypothetical protein
MYATAGHLARGSRIGPMSVKTTKAGKVTLRTTGKANRMSVKLAQSGV